MNENKTTPIWILAAGLVVSSLTMASSLEAGASKLWPFASKKHIKQQVDPVSGRVSELEEISRQHGARIKEIDERTQTALRATMSQLEATDAKAIAAGTRNPVLMRRFSSCSTLSSMITKTTRTIIAPA